MTRFIRLGLAAVVAAFLTLFVATGFVATKAYARGGGGGGSGGGGGRGGGGGGGRGAGAGAGGGGGGGRAGGGSNNPGSGGGRGGKNPNSPGANPAKNLGDYLVQIQRDAADDARPDFNAGAREEALQDARDKERDKMLEAIRTRQSQKLRSDDLPRP